MRNGGSKAKGSSFERDVCKKLSLYITNGERADCLWRSSMSGGRATIQIKKGQENKAQVGDISSIDILSHKFISSFYVECKHYRTLDLVPGLVHSRGALHSFWVKLVKDAKEAKKCPALIAKQNHLPTLLLVSPLGASLLNIPKDAMLATLVKWPVEVYLFEGLLSSKYPF